MSVWKFGCLAWTSIPSGTTLRKTVFAIQVYNYTIHIMSIYNIIILYCNIIIILLDGDNTIRGVLLTTRGGVVFLYFQDLWNRCITCSVGG